MSIPNPYRCAAHPEREAGWRCGACERQLCPGCTVRVLQQTSATSYDVCAHCDGITAPLTVVGAPATAVFRMAQVFHMPAGLFSVGLLVAIFACLGWLHGMESGLGETAAATLLAAVFWMGFFTVAHAAARATNELQSVASVQARALILLPGLRALVWSAVWLVPLFRVQSLRGVPMERWLLDPLAWLWCLGLSLIAPASLVLLACGEGLRAALSPRRLRSTIQALGADYRSAVALVLATTLFSLAELVACDHALRHGAAFLTAVPRALAFYAQLLTARVVGLLLEVHGYALGYPDAPAHQVPVLPDAQPTGTWRPRPEASGTSSSRAPLELSPEHPEGQPTEGQRVEEVLVALRAKDLAAAVACYANLPEPLDPWLSVASLFSLGQAAAAHGNYGLSVRALKVASRRAPDDPLAPRACLLLARVYAERLGDADSAARLYRHILQRYPGTEAARFAQARLSA